MRGVLRRKQATHGHLPQLSLDASPPESSELISLTGFFLEILHPLARDSKLALRCRRIVPHAGFIGIGRFLERNLFLWIALLI